MGSYTKCDRCGIRFSYHDGHSCDGRNEAPRVTVENLTRQLAEAREEIARLREIMQAIIDFDPPEVCKDEFAYDRLKEAYRTAAKVALEAS